MVWCSLDFPNQVSLANISIKSGQVSNQVKQVKHLKCLDLFGALVVSDGEEEARKKNRDEKEPFDCRPKAFSEITKSAGRAFCRKLAFTALHICIR
jgi:hypothetical protein